MKKRDYEFQPGERVSWAGWIDMGKTPVRWHGTVVQNGYGVPFYDDPPRLSPEGYALEAGRYPAVRVVADLPQHGKVDVWESVEQHTVVAVKDLQREPTVDSLRTALAECKAALRSMWESDHNEPMPDDLRRLVEGE